MGRLVTRTSIVAGGGSIADGNAFTMNGSGFGTNSVTQVWTGGVNGIIESIASGTGLKTGASGAGLLGGNWVCNTGYSETQQWVSDLRSFSGTKSIRNRYGYNVYSGGTYDTGNFQFALDYDFGSGYQAIYSNVCFNLENNGQTAGQVKFKRWVGPDGSNYDDNDYPNVLLNQYGFAAFNLTADAGTLTRTDSIADPIWSFDNWVRMEVLFTPGTSGTANGSIQYRITLLTDGTVLSSGTISSATLWRNADPAYSHFIIQGYISNEMQSDGAELFIDRDIYAVANLSGTTVKYVLLGDASTYAGCTKRLLAVQPFSSWADTSIDITINKGPHTNLTGKYLYAMNGIDSAINSSGIALS
jgi:hypothetical protein